MLIFRYLKILNEVYFLIVFTVKDCIFVGNRAFNKNNDLLT